MAAAALVGIILLYVFGPSASARAARTPREKPQTWRARLFGWLPRPHLPRWRRVAVDHPIALETGPRREPLLLDATGAESFDDEPEMPSRRSASVDLPPRERKIKRLRQASLALDADQVLPSLELLAEVPPTRTAAVNEEALQQNARLLESVLEDFGVRGQIVKVRPGPVVALYELEPAAGIKASRVIGLADDIARSMSALSARVAVIPGRSVLGIELPNARSEMVFLRELLASEAYERSSAKLPLVLGKDIGGAPVIADLQRMPHLLIAGTTGSGKSVGINTMILSILYRLSSDQCKFIMIDPKMLELSMYDDIPHLLAPVVTEPRKAVVALKWTVREMENRYRAMSKLGVRNIEGYNQRIAEAKAKGEVLMRRVQTGFDEETGRPVFEEQPLSNDPLPLIVVVVDEMADLMLVAGKDIEHAVQRLAQMARAAGIHIIMATQRPSVDVITGTIKANFPTRISFQVTSKIDSRTILGEAGAEQLLGRGDMLHMAGGGRITRVHGPFVSDQEVEAVVRFLKENGPPPAYLEDVTADEEDEMAAFAEDGESSGDQLYDQAVNLVLRERKASTSFVQRHLQIGYNRAARIIERMESEGVISAANHVGKREVLGRGRD
ncbi:MAG: DNA translocase FtsK [Alphaproteobacteria bacterium]|nr:DNA translocase FtsK [Alphaproteobacteria bacterium]